MHLGKFRRDFGWARSENLNSGWQSCRFVSESLIKGKSFVTLEVEFKHSNLYFFR